MTFSFLTTDQLISTPVLNYENMTLVADARVLLGVGNGIQATGDLFGVVSNIGLNLHGDILTGGNGVDLQHGLVNETENTNVTVFETSTIASGGDGITMREGVNNTITNFGHISVGGDGISSGGGEISIGNYGIIQVSGGSGNAIAIDSNAAGDNIREIANAGVIHHRVDAIGTAILNDGGAKFVISNTGTINAGTANTAISSTATVNSFYNSGAITGDVVLSNSATVYNTGSIDGSITLSSASDFFNGRKGDVTGAISGGDGDDIYVVNNTEDTLIEVFDEGIDLVRSTVSFSLVDNFEELKLLTNKNINGIGNNDDNILNGNHGDNRLQGQAGDDYIHGRLGDDKLFGSFDHDTLIGGKGDDVLKGGTGNDYLNGSNGFDMVIGGTGTDVLTGDRGDDTLVGGAGQDTLTGGLDDDVFLFNRIAHSSMGASDTITDFSAGQDLIDLSAFNGTLAFIGTDTFSGAKEVRYEDNGTDWTVFVDVNGNASADMRITVNSSTALTELDFVL